MRSCLDIFCFIFCNVTQIISHIAYFIIHLTSSIIHPTSYLVSKNRKCVTGYSITIGVGQVPVPAST